MAEGAKHTAAKRKRLPLYLGCKIKTPTFLARTGHAVEVRQSELLNRLSLFSERQVISLGRVGN